MNPKLETNLFFWKPFLKVWEILTNVLAHIIFPRRKMTLRTRLNPLGSLAIAFWMSNVWDIESNFHPKSWKYDFPEICEGGLKWVWRSSRECLGAFGSAYDLFGCTQHSQAWTSNTMNNDTGHENDKPDWSRKWRFGQFLLRRAVLKDCKWLVEHISESNTASGWG